MPVVRPVTLIAVVALTMGLALDVIGGAHRGHVAPECWAITKLRRIRLYRLRRAVQKTHADYFLGLVRTNRGRNCARTGPGRVCQSGPTALPTEDILVQRGL
jgi:hypothetical protein